MGANLLGCFCTTYVERKSFSNQIGTVVLGGTVGHTAPVVVLIRPVGIAAGDPGDPVIIIVGIRSGAGIAVDRFRLAGKIIQLVIGIGGGVAEVGAGFGVLHEPAGEVIIVFGGQTAGGVCYRCQFAAVVVLISDGVAVWGHRGRNCLCRTVPLCNALSAGRSFVLFVYQNTLTDNAQLISR